jgi:2-methylisoborneol synthase
MTHEPDGPELIRLLTSAALSAIPGAAPAAGPAMPAAGAPAGADDAAVPAGADLVARLLAGPSGLGTSACRIPGAPPREVPAAPSRDVHAPLPYVEREWGDGSYPPLYCAPTVRIDDDLGDEVNRRLVAWAGEVGIYADQIDKFRDTGFGRLIMLTHSDSDDPDLLLVAGQMNAAWWAADDYYADETELGATPTELPPRLALVMSAMDPPAPAGEYTRQLDEVLRADPVLVAMSSATAHLARHGTPSQVMRACHSTAQMFVSWAASAAWRYLQTPPPVWRYLAARMHDSFYTSMTLIDVVSGYELPANLFDERRVHSALMQAGMAAVIVNDLHSVAREASDELPDSNLVLLIAAEEDCTIRAATERAVALHNESVRDFESSQRELAAIPSAELQRFLRGAQAWMGGSFEWHSTSSRYR